MKKYLHIALMLLCVAIVSSSCKKDKDDSLDAEKAAYKLENEKAFLAKGGDPEYIKWDSEAGDGFVYAKQIKKGDGKKIYFNSRISVYYKGYLINNKKFDQRLKEDGVPFKCAVNYNYANYNSSTGAGYSSVINGWGIALQHMVEGDKYEIWIPQELGYGANDTENIPAYSTLVFEIEVVSVDEQAAKPNS